MGGFCPNSNIKVLPSPVIQEENTVDPQIEIDTLINQETNYKLSLIHNFSLENPTLQTCDEVILEILSISISFMVKDFSEQSNFLKIQIQKQIQELVGHKVDFQEDLLTMLINYYDFLSYVQENGRTKVVSWWKDPVGVVEVEQAIKHWSQEFIKYGGKLRREKAFRQITNDPKPPERFVKTREWIKKQSEGQEEELKPKREQLALMNNFEDGFEES
ncbi:unnamed protein product (macronuclear) [Paramecium tetraurelia]|uniref:Uncharacterized protein n=1 Tax=Paramecium tetraurelia TaxID=5888 RepID=A0DWF3_PARTE|nr:uncharacterized protein GSPATT00021012001 [Paramecium tetraurelia]CAK87370.1 unnamed protein product [Paramecium tetraurelia]|eukprot:XP_001454767.1 hypothetical protein (macronuclear) [Paramecium tetraurelia strain d4-2]